MLTNERIAEMCQAERNMVALTGASEAIREMASEYAEALEELLARRDAPIAFPKVSGFISAQEQALSKLKSDDAPAPTADYTIFPAEPETANMGPISQADGDSDIWGTGGPQ